MRNDGIEANDVSRAITGMEGQVLYGTEFFGEVLNTTGRVAPARNPDERCNPATWKETSMEPRSPPVRGVRMQGVPMAQ